MELRHMELTYPRSRRLRKRAEFLRIQRGNRGKRGPHFVLIACPGPTEDVRLGITVSRRVGSAVKRNSIKRRVREFFRLNYNKLQPAHDFVVIARAGADSLSYRDVETELAALVGINTE
ncbi:MAG: ribonuclease P protein component [Proteobacteria bacterium]|nr:ribonuclease P protein component [Pseudomonadota bacterium]